MQQHGIRFAVVTALLREQKELARTDPLGLAPIILFALRQRQEVRAVHRLAWGIVLGVPGEQALHSLREVA